MTAGFVHCIYLFIICYVCLCIGGMGDARETH